MIDVVAAGVLAACAVATVWWARRRLIESVHRDFTLPLVEAASIVDRIYGGETIRVSDIGAQSVRNLARRVNQYMTASIENSQLSQAKLLSVEAAFDRIHAVLRTLVDGVIVVNSRREVVLANQAAKDIVGASGAFEGRALADVIRGSLLELVSESLQRIEAGGNGRMFAAVEYAERILDIEVSRVRTPGDSQSCGTLIVLHDVTKSHEIARLKDEFLSSVSHELRTPLTNIIAYTEIVCQMTEQSPESREFLDIIQEESKRLHRLVDNVLEYSRLEAGDVEWEFEDVCVADVLRSSVSVFAERAATRGIHIECTIDSDAQSRVDRSRLASVFANVLDNAIKFADPDSSIVVDMVTAAGVITIGIDDAGPGVPEDQREAIFERLTQLGDTLVDKPPGTGMGLSICAATLRQLGGSIRCESSALGGARFVIELPALVPAPSA
ncbi:MAG: PAS domain-containing sensor histidine kinase [Planctomycetes bacterium]|nr:PAS domain-containing sensor histidine kinase [Planctomycetota bacterium]